MNVYEYINNTLYLTFRIMSNKMEHESIHPTTSRFNYEVLLHLGKIYLTFSVINKKLG